MEIAAIIQNSGFFLLSQQSNENKQERIDNKLIYVEVSGLKYF